MNQVKVSIIVPIYNSSRYLNKCIESCLNQTLDEVEIILIDDASSDNSATLIAEYAANHPDKIIAMYLEENLHQGGARNRGIQIAKGEYLCFVDSDDWIEPTMCYELYYAAKIQDADMAGGNCFISTEISDKPEKLNYVSSEFGEYNIDKLQQYLSDQGYFWNRIYKREYVLKNNILFPEHIFYEDAYFNFLTALYAKNVVKVEKCFYHYYQSPNSTVRVKNNPRAYDRISIARLIAEDCRNRGLYARYKDIIDFKFISMSASNIVYSCMRSFDEPEIKRLQEIQADIKRLCPNYQHNPYYRSLAFDLRWYLNHVVHNPLFSLWCYRHHIDVLFGYMEVIKRKFRL